MLGCQQVDQDTECAFVFLSQCQASYRVIYSQGLMLPNPSCTAKSAVLNINTISLKRFMIYVDHLQTVELKGQFFYTLFKNQAMNSLEIWVMEIFYPENSSGDSKMLSAQISLKSCSSGLANKQV